MYTFYVLESDQSNKAKTRYILVEGYKLPYGLGAYKRSEGRWIVTDVKTGGKVLDNLSRFTDIAPHLKDQAFLNNLIEARKTKRYERMVNQLEKQKSLKKGDY